MKNLKIIMFALLCALGEASSHAMDTKPDTAQKPYTSCHLGERYSDDRMAPCEHRRDIIVDGRIVGYMHYSDSRENGVLERFLEEFKIDNLHPHLRGHGIGTLCLTEFLNDAKKDQVKLVGLSSMPKAKTLYARFGFNELKPYNPYMEKRID